MRSLRSRVGAVRAVAAVGLGVGAIALASLGAQNAFATKQDATGFSIYRGEAGAASGVTASDWGSGHVVEDTTVYFSGKRSLKIDTQGLYQGVKLALATPGDLTPFLANKSAYVSFELRLPGDEQAGGARAGGRFGRGGGGGLTGGAGRPGGIGGASRRGANGQSGRIGIQAKKDLKNLRLVFTTTRGKAAEMFVPTSIAGTDSTWKRLSIPVSAIPGLDASDAKIDSISIFGDAPATIYIGQISVLTDGTPISVERPDPVVFPKGQSHQFVGQATGGHTPLKYSWDFNAADGIQEDADGRAVDRTYYKTGDYVVTLTVSDYFGFKAPAHTSFRISITP